jgi:cytochrome c oxidase subunit 3
MSHHTASTSNHHVADAHATPYYYIPHHSSWPLVGSFALFFFGLGASGWVNNYSYGVPSFAIGMAILSYMFFGWFKEVALESESGLYSKRIDISFRWSMSWFIFSEIMFFAALFGALFYAKDVTTPWLSDLDHQAYLWPQFAGSWPNLGAAGLVEDFAKMSIALPTVNTALLLTSGLTLTLSHHAIVDNKRSPAILWLSATILLGLIFLGCQGFEYYEAYHEYNLKLTSGFYGSIFFMLTGFHGFHVLVGTIMLMSILGRLMSGHFKSDNHFGFEAAAWYWHFVDVVWLLLYVVVYWM